LHLVDVQLSLWSCHACTRQTLFRAAVLSRMTYRYSL